MAELRETARRDMTTCKVCRECNGVACRGKIPGVGGKGNGDCFVRNFQKLSEIKLNLDTVYDLGKIDTSVELFGKRVPVPAFAGPMASIEVQFGDKYTTAGFQRVILESCEENGMLMFLPEGDLEMLVPLCEQHKGIAIPTIKPWPIDVVIEKAQALERAGALAIATDLDGAGLKMVQGGSVPVMPHGVEDLKKLVSSLNVPVMVKGIMTVKAALRCAEAGVSAIVVSNHGGRVLEQARASIEVLEPIATAVGDKMKVLFDGAVRTGSDIFKARALGAHSVIVGRPYAVAIYGGGAEGVSLYAETLREELHEAMMMTGAETLDDITRDMVYVPPGFSD